MKFTKEVIEKVYNLPLTTLIFKAQEIHHKFQYPAGIQLCTLKSIKTGSCPEDCKYCPQSAHHNTFVEPERLLNTQVILRDALVAKANGASRFCMGAAWKCVPEGKQFDSVLNTVSEVSNMGLEVCVTLGTLKEDQAVRLKDAGASVYNHNLDTSREHYKNIITTRTYDDRLETISNVRKAGLEVCTGGILGLGEKEEDRIGLLWQLSNMEPQPDSVPINALVAVEGTPLENQEFVDSIEFVRAIATARIFMPKSIVRLSAGRTEMSEETQTLCFLAGANSIFMGDKLLTTPNPESNDDAALMKKLGLHPLDPQKAREIHELAEASL
jgi:biotin synthase